jgi:hypothetical protein
MSQRAYLNAPGIIMFMNRRLNNPIAGAGDGRVEPVQAQI